MFKYLRNFWFSFLILGCTSENFVDGKIQRESARVLNPKTVEKYTNSFDKSKSLSLFGAQEIVNFDGKSIIKNAENEFFLLSNFDKAGQNFNLEKIFIEKDAENVKTFFFFQGELYACVFKGGNIELKKCVKSKDDTVEDKLDVLPIAKYELTDTNFSFNSHSESHLAEDFTDKMRYGIWRQINKNHKKDIKLSDIDKDGIDISLLDSLVCCSNCVVCKNNISFEGYFFLVKCNVKVSVVDGGGKNDVVVPMNLGLFFDGEDFFPCSEGGSDNSFYNGTFCDFSVLSMKSCGDKIACYAKRSIVEDPDQALEDFVILGELFLDSEYNVCFKLISSNIVENLKSFTFLKTEGEGAILTTIFVDNLDNKVKFGRLVKNDFSCQSADLSGIDLYEAKAVLPDRTRLKDYNMTFIGGNDILLQYRDPIHNNHALDYLLALNKLKIPICG